MKITALEKGSRNRYRLEVDGVAIGSLYAGEVEKLHLEAGGEIDQASLDEVKHILTVRAKKYVFHLLGKRDYTVSDIERKLAGNGLSEPLAKEVTGYFSRLGYLNDANYALGYMRTYSGRKSLKQMRYELVQKGLSREEIALAMEVEPVDDMESARAHFIKKKQAMLARNGQVDYKKIGDYLMRKGYSYAVISKLIRDEEKQS